jgi:hypothetical protein
VRLGGSWSHSWYVCRINVTLQTPLHPLPAREPHCGPDSLRRLIFFNKVEQHDLVGALPPVISTVLTAFCYESSYQQFTTRNGMDAFNDCMPHDQRRTTCFRNTGLIYVLSGLAGIGESAVAQTVAARSDSPQSLGASISFSHEAKLTAETPYSKEQSAPVITLAFSPDCSRLASGSMDGTITIWDTCSPCRPIGTQKVTFRGDFRAGIQSRWRTIGFWVKGQDC